MRQHHAHEYTLRIPGAATRPGARLKKTMQKGLENISLPLRGFVRRFNVSNLEEFSFRRKRQYSHDEGLLSNLEEIARGISMAAGKRERNRTE